LPIDATRLRIPLPERGVEIALLDWGGEGPIALIHHATGLLAAPYGLLAAALRHRFRVIGVDARGHGDSSKPGGGVSYHWRHLGDDLAALTERLLTMLGKERVGLAIGHSLGGAAIFAAAAQRPELFERLALVDMAGLPKQEAHIHRAFLAQVAASSRKRRNRWRTRAEARGRWTTNSFFQEWDPRALDLYVKEGLGERGDGSLRLKCPPEIEAMVFLNGTSLDLPALAPMITAPPLFLWAGHGSFLRKRYEALIPLMSDARIEHLATGHMAPLENPELVARALLGFTATPT